MNDHQLELWSAEPHPIPPIYQNLPPEERCLLTERLARLILSQVLSDHPEQPDPPIHHER